MASPIRINPRGLRRLIERLATPEGLGHPVEDLEVIETHVSCVLLAGPFAYKFKKPVDFGFLAPCWLSLPVCGPCNWVGWLVLSLLSQPVMGHSCHCCRLAGHAAARRDCD